MLHLLFAPLTTARSILKSRRKLEHGRRRIVHFIRLGSKDHIRDRDKISPLYALALSLPLAVPRGSGSDETGGLDQALGGQMSGLGDLGNQFIDANQGT